MKPVARTARSPDHQGREFQHSYRFARRIHSKLAGVAVQTFEYQPPNATAGTVRITEVLGKIDGRWMIVHHHEGMVPTGVPLVDERPGD